LNSHLPIAFLYPVEKEMEKYFDRLWPICRSITGNGLRQSLHILDELVPLALTEVPSGVEVFDWTIPDEWNIRDAWIETPNGEKICRLSENNLHVVNYSVPVNREINFPQLDKHLHHLPGQPDAIPYITSYYHRSWGFCLSENQYQQLPREGKYKVFIDATLAPGSLTYSEAVLPGKTDREILFSSYLCHPSMAVNELSGPLVCAFLFRELEKLADRKYTYRFLFAPETIGVIAFLHHDGIRLKEKLEAGFVVTCVGHEGKFTYKKSKRANSLADKAAVHFLQHNRHPSEIIEYAIGGSDERQYCSPGFNLPVGSLMRTMYKTYPEYHTSLDNKSIVSFRALSETVEAYLSIAQSLELNECYTSVLPYCEPQLGKRGLYPSSGAWQNRQDFRMNMLHFLSYADGSMDLFDIADKRGKHILEFSDVVATCKQHGLV